LVLLRIYCPVHHVREVSAKRPGASLPLPRQGGSRLTCDLSSQARMCWMNFFACHMQRELSSQTLNILNFMLCATKMHPVFV